jgi:hypothetical protein
MSRPTAANWMSPVSLRHSWYHSRTALVRIQGTGSSTSEFKAFASSSILVSSVVAFCQSNLQGARHTLCFLMDGLFWQHSDPVPDTRCLPPLRGALYRFPSKGVLDRFLLRMQVHRCITTSSHLDIVALLDISSSCENDSAN